jgi:hypothetical protein
MKKHLKRKHDIDVDQLVSDSKTTGGTPKLKDVFAKQRKLELNDKRSQDIIQIIGNVIVKDMRPISIVEDVGFRELVSFFEPRFTMTSRKYMSSNVIPKMYFKAKKKLSNLVLAADSVSLTADAWTSRANENYLTITAHLLTNWNMSSFVLSTEEMSESHSAKNLADRFLQILNEWKLSSVAEIPIYLTTDNASNIVKGKAWFLLFTLHTSKATRLVM